MAPATAPPCRACVRQEANGGTPGHPGYPLGQANKRVPWWWRGTGEPQQQGAEGHQRVRPALLESL